MKLERHRWLVAPTTLPPEVRGSFRVTPNNFHGWQLLPGLSPDVSRHEYLSSNSPCWSGTHLRFSGSHA